MSSNEDLKRYKRLYKLTGDFGWIAKYAEEEGKVAGKPYSVPTVGDFVKWLVYGNVVAFPGHPLQGMLGSVAARVLAKYYKENLDLDEEAFKDIEMKSDLGSALSKSLLSFESDDLDKIKHEIRRGVSKLGDHHASEYAEKLDDAGIQDLIKFALIRGYMSTYWMFLFNNPIVSIILENQGKEDKSAPLTLKSFLRHAAKPEQEEAEQAEKAYEDIEEFQDDLDSTLEKNPRQKAQEEFLSEKADRIRLSHLVHGLKLLRLQYFKRLEQAIYSKESSEKIHLLRIDYMAVDATIVHLDKVKRAIQAYLKADPKNRFRSFKGQPLAGADGKGDIWVAKLDPARPWRTIQDIHEGSFLRESNINIPWVDVDGKPAVFASDGPSIESNKDAVLEQRYVGSIIPKYEDILKHYVYEAYTDKEVNGVVVSGKEILAAEVKKKVLEDAGLLTEFAEKLSKSKKLKMNESGSFRKARTILFTQSAKKEDIVQAANVIYDIILKHTKEQIKASQSPSDYTRGLMVAMNAIIQDVEDVPRQWGVELPLHDDWRISIRTVIGEVWDEIGIVTNIGVVSDAVGNSVRDSIMNHPDYDTLSAKVSALYKLFPEKKQITKSDPLYSVFTEGKDEEYLKDVIEVDVIKELNSDIVRAINDVVHQVDQQTGFVPGSDKLRIAKPYVEQLYGPVKDKLAKKYASLIAGADGKSPKVKIVKPGKKPYWSPVKDPIKDLIESMAAQMYPDIAKAAWGMQYFVDYLGGVHGGHMFTKTPRNKDDKRKNFFAGNWLKGATSVITEENIGKELMDRLRELYVWQDRPATVPQDLVEKIRQALKDNNVTYKAGKEVYGPDYIVDEMLIKLGKITSFTHNAAKDLAAILGSEAFGEQYAAWRDEARAAQRRADPKRAEEEHAVEIEKAYGIVKENWKEFGLPAKLMTWSSRGGKIMGEFGITKEVWNDVLDEVRNWVLTYSGEPGDPHSKIRALVERARPGFDFDPVWAQGIYAVIGEALFMFLNQKKTYGSEANPLGLNDLEYHVWKRFNFPKQRGAEGLPMEGAANISPEGVISSGPSEADQALAAEQAKHYVKEVLESNVFNTVFTRKTQHEINLERDQGIQHNRPMLALSTQSPGGWIQQMMGYSLSGNMKQYLQSNYMMMAWFGNSAGFSFGDHVLQKVMGDLRSLYTHQENQFGMIVKPAKYDSKWELMEAVGAFADPTWAYNTLTQAFKKLQRKKMLSGAVSNDPDTAEDHLIRIAYNLNSITESDLKEGFDRKVAEIKKAFPFVDPTKLETYLIIRFKNEDKQRTNSPFANMTPEEMQDKFAKIGVAPELLEAYFGKKFREQMIEKAQGANEYFLMPDFNSITDLHRQEHGFIKDLEDLWKMRVFNASGLKRVLEGYSTGDQALDGLLEEATEIVIGKLSGKVKIPKDKDGKDLPYDYTKDPEAQRAVEVWSRARNGNYDLLQQEFEAIVTALPQRYDPVRHMLFASIRGIVDANSKFHKKQAEYDQFARDLNSRLEKLHQYIDEQEKERKRQLEEGDKEEVEEIEENIEQVEKQLPEAENPHIDQLENAGEVGATEPLAEPPAVAPQKPVPAPAEPKKRVMRRDKGRKTQEEEMKEKMRRKLDDAQQRGVNLGDMLSDPDEPTWGDSFKENQKSDEDDEQKIAKNRSQGLTLPNIEKDIWDDGERYHFS